MCYPMIKCSVSTRPQQHAGRRFLQRHMTLHFQWYDPVPPSALMICVVIRPLESAINSKLHLCPLLRPAVTPHLAAPAAHAFYSPSMAARACCEHCIALGLTRVQQKHVFQYMGLHGISMVECVASRSKRSLPGASFSVVKICKIQQCVFYLEKIFLHIPDQRAL